MRLLQAICKPLPFAAGGRRLISLLVQEVVFLFSNCFSHAGSDITLPQLSCCLPFPSHTHSHTHTHTHTRPPPPMQPFIQSKCIINPHNPTCISQAPGLNCDGIIVTSVRTASRNRLLRRTWLHCLSLDPTRRSYWPRVQKQPERCANRFQRRRVLQNQPEPIP